MVNSGKIRETQQLYMRKCIPTDRQGTSNHETFIIDEVAEEINVLTLVVNPTASTREISNEIHISHESPAFVFKMEIED